MKKLLCCLTALFFLFPCFCVGDSVDEYKAAFDQVKDLAATYQFAELVEQLPGLKEKYPDLFADEYYDRMMDYAQQGAELMSGLSSFYDEFDEAYYYWIGDKQQANEENNCVSIIDSNGPVLSFFFPVNDYIGINDYVAIFDWEEGHERMEGAVSDPEFDNIGSMMYEAFYIPLSEFPDTVSALAFRFYGEKKNLDFTLSEEQLADMNLMSSIDWVSGDLHNLVGNKWFRHYRDITGE